MQMRKMNTFLTLIFAFCAVVSFAQPTPNEVPPNSEAGKCYAKCIIPDEYRDVEERIQVRPASTKTVVTPAEYETVTERVLLKEASTRIIPKPAVYEPATERVLKSEGAASLRAVAAEFETVTERVLVKEASTRIVSKPAVYETVTERVLIKEASTRIVPSPPVHETVTERVLIRPASSRLVVKPAQFETRTERVLVKEASSRIVAKPAVYEPVTERVLIRAASSRIETVPAEYRTDTETIETKPASTKWVKKKADKNCLSADPNDCLVWCLVEQPAQYRTISKRVRVGCPVGYQDKGDDCIKEIDIPAEYGERTYQKLVQPASTETIEIPAEYGERTYTVKVAPASSETIEIPAEYGERTYQKLVQPATTEVIEIPAEYGERTYRKLVSPATTEVIEIPAEYGERTYQKLVRAAAVVDVPCGGGSVSGSSRTLENVFFESGSATLKPESHDEIRTIKNLLDSRPDVTVAIVGHTDADGSEESNQRLSRARAKSVHDLLASWGASTSRMTYEGRGESQPRATNATPEGKRQNRRTELVVYDKGQVTETTIKQGDCNNYEDRVYQKLVQPATTEVVEIPAEYGERSYQKLARPAGVTTVDIPAEYQTIMKRELVRPGGFTEWREVVCNNNITPDLHRSVQDALRREGYDPGPSDNIMGAQTKSALIKFQKDKNLPVGNLDFETLKALGIYL